MKIKKYYSLDECMEQEEVFTILNDLQDLEKIDYEVIKDDIYGDVIKIDDVDMSITDHKKLIEDFNRLDVIDFPDYGYDQDEDDIDEEEEDDFNDDDDRY